MRDWAFCSGMFAAAAIGAAANHRPGLLVACVFAAVICWKVGGRSKA